MLWWVVFTALAGPELCNGLDDDGDGVVDEGPVLVGVDGDADGHGSVVGARLQPSCDDLGGFSVADDCNDSAPLAHGGAVERCNGLDDDCDGEIDEGACGCDDTALINDEDVLQVCLTPRTWFAADQHCDDLGYHLVTARYPHEQEGLFTVVDPYDRDIWLGLSDLSVEGVWEWVLPVPFDYDNWRAYEPNDGGLYGEDCAEMEPSGLWDDEDCSVAQAYVCEVNCTPVSWFVDDDGDGLGDPAREVVACEAPQGAVSNDADCDDADASEPGLYWYDADQDGFGGDERVAGCVLPWFAVEGGDCDDARSDVHPGAADPAGDQLDADCDGLDGPPPEPTGNTGDTGAPSDTAGTADTGGPTTGTAEPTSDTGRPRDTGAPTEPSTTEGGPTGTDATTSGPAPAPRAPDYGFGCATAPGTIGWLSWLAVGLARARRRPTSSPRRSSPRPA